MAVAGLVAAACGGGGGDDDGSSASAIGDLDREYADVLVLVIDDVQEFWGVQMPEVYDQEYDELPEENVVPYTSETDIDDLGECGEGLTYEDVADNASYCRADDHIVWDDETLFPELYENYEEFALALALVHEWGHYIQKQVEYPEEGVVRETQADCFAGSWAGWVADGSSELLDMDPGDLDNGVAGMLEVRDPVGFDPEAENAHGSGFDRVAAFQSGFEGGAETCRDWDPDIVAMPFDQGNQEEIESAGNLDFDELVPTTTEDLALFWEDTVDGYESPSDVIAYDVEEEDTLPECGSADLSADDLENEVFYCPPDDFVAYDEPFLERVYEDEDERGGKRFGDFGPAMLIANAWAESIQVQLDTGTDDLQLDCFVGLWAGTVPPRSERDATFSYSPGDLDEVIAAFLQFADRDEDADDVFERVQSLRVGFVAEGDLDACA